MKHSDILKEIDSTILWLLGRTDINNIKREFANWFVLTDKQLLNRYTREELLYRLERLRKLESNVNN